MINETEHGMDCPEVEGMHDQEYQDIDRSSVPVPMTPEEIIARWGITEAKLKLLIQHSGLPCYLKNVEGQEPLDPNMLASAGLFKTQFLYFMSSDIEDFEDSHQELQPQHKRREEFGGDSLRNSQRHRERCRALAEYHWTKHPDDAIADLAKEYFITKIGCEGHEYKDKATIRNWIKDLCPNPRRGRPSKD